MKAVLKYTDCLQDARRVFAILAQHNIEVIKTKPGLSICPRITINIKDYNELNLLVEHLNKETTYGVVIVKVKSRKIKNMEV